LAVPLLKVAANFYNNMATFDSAQVTVWASNNADMA
jgi:nicotinate-nucleotide--dimethylbenzimidazole phosphoribosyltransferase